MGAADRWLRCVGVAARAFADAVDAELCGVVPGLVGGQGTEGTERTEGTEKARFSRALPTEQVLECPLCGAPARPAPKSGRSWFRCERGHHFDRHEPPVPLA